MVWVDPDRTGELVGHHPLWSDKRPAPVELRRTDYFDGGHQPIGPAVRDLVAEPIGHRPDGPVRMLTQPRTWGWLFNPITVYLVWEAGAAGDAPLGAVLEVTNTPWKERTTYAVALEPHTSGERRGVGAVFAKTLHVSPFLDEAFTYRLLITEHRRRSGVRRLIVDLDCIQQPNLDGSDVKEPTDLPVLTTRLIVDRHRPHRRAMTKSLLTNPFPTHRVSFGIHRQALTLWRKKVPFVAHPRKRTTPTTSSASGLSQ
jgi:DUF1365 family protein